MLSDPASFCFFDKICFIAHGRACSAVQTNRIIDIQTKQEILHLFIPHAIPETDQIIRAIFSLCQTAERIIIAVVNIPPVTVREILSIRMEPAAITGMSFTTSNSTGKKQLDLENQYYSLYNGTSDDATAEIPNPERSALLLAASLHLSLSALVFKYPLIYSGNGI